MEQCTGCHQVTLLRKLRDGTRKEFPSPTATDIYDKYMGWVDYQCGDIIISELSAGRIINICYGIDVAIVNAQILYTKHTDL